LLRLLNQPSLESSPTRQGAVLPGVTVEAASDALIEKVRVDVSDSSGQYRILDLRPGTYKVSFKLPGFNTFVRDGLVLPADFVSTVNAELRVGTLEETVTGHGGEPDRRRAEHTAPDADEHGADRVASDGAGIRGHGDAHALVRHLRRRQQ
jgi:hypothetical protein